MVAPVNKTKKKDPLKHIHSKFAPSHNADTGKTSEIGSAATSAPTPTSSAAPVAFLSSIATVLATDGGVRGDVSEELISPRTIEVAPALISMRQGVAGGANIPVGGCDSNNAPDNVEVDGTSPNRDTEQADPTAEAGTHVVDTTVVQNKAPVVIQQTVQMDPQAKTVPATNGAETTTCAAPQITSKTVVSTRKSPRKKAASTNSAHDQDGKRDAIGYIPASSLFPPAAQSKTAASTQAKGPGDATIQQPSVSRVDKLLASPRLQHTHVPLNMGVPYTPTIDQHGKGTGNKTVINIPDTTPRLPVRPKAVGTDDNEMFVDLSPLAAAKTFLQKQSEPKERHPMAFTPPSCSLGLDLS